MMEIQVVSVVLLHLVVVMVVDIHTLIMSIDKEDLVDLVVEPHLIRLTVLLIEVVLVRQVDLEHLAKGILADMADVSGPGVQVISNSWVVAAVELAVLVVIHHFQITMLHNIHHHHILYQLGVDGTVLLEAAALENQILLFQ